MSLVVTQADIATPPILVELTGLPVVDTPAAGAVTGIVQRQVDGVRWVTVRGCVDMEVDGSGDCADVSDYEFRPGVLNSYRGGVMQQIVATFTSNASNAWPNTDTGDTWDTSGSQWNSAGGVGTILHAAANTSFLAVLTSPLDIGDCRIGVTFKGSAALTGGPIQWGIRPRRLDANNFYDVNIESSVTTNVMTLRTRARIGGVLTPFVTTVLPDTYDSTKKYRVEVDLKGTLFRARVWDPTVRPRPDWQAVYSVPSGLRLTAGGIAIASFRDSTNTTANFTTSVDDITVDTGSPSFLSGLTDTITPGLAGFWLCSVMRSFLNSAPMVIAYGEPSRKGRGGLVPIAGRTLPIGVGELMGGRSWPVTFRAPSLASARRLEMALASGDTFYLQAPADCPIPFGFYRVSGFDSRRATPRSDKRSFEVQIDEVAAPGPDITTAQNTWDSVIAEYGTWEAVVLAGVTWEDLRDDLIGEPDEVIVE